MRQLVEEIAKALVDLPEQVTVREVQGEQVTVLELRVAPSDLGKVIGKQGRTARSIRTLLGAAGMKLNRRFTLEILERILPPDFVIIAHLERPRGNKGELASVPLSDKPERVKRVFVNGTEYEVENVWRHSDRVVFKFRGVDSISAAEKLSGADVAIPLEERAPLPQGEYYQTDLVGCSVVTRQGEPIGTVEGWEEYGGPPLLEVSVPGRGPLLIPFARSICVEIDVLQRRIVVDLPEGLRDL